HVVANHSWNHSNLARLDLRRVNQEVDKTNRVISEITGRSPMLFRAPYGSLDRRVERLIDKKGMIIVHWNVDTRDWDGRSSDSIIRTVRQQAGPGSVILQHTASRNLDNTVKALPRIIADLKKRGYELVTVPELLGVPAYKEDPEKQGTLGAIR
ncbi:MAG: polysaccharide deacetylase family protein, partial [Planifilum fulgidum]